MNSTQSIPVYPAHSISEYPRFGLFSEPTMGFTDEYNSVSRNTGVTAGQQEIQIEPFGTTSNSAGNTFGTWSLDSLIDYIVKVHHRILKEDAIIIHDLAHKAAYHHLGSVPRLSKLASALFLFLDDLLFHLRKEEQILFQNIRQLGKAKSCTLKKLGTTLELIKESAGLMMKEHITINAELNEFRELTNDFTPPGGASHWHKDLFMKMKKFESDLSVHINLENQVVFPRAVLLAEKYYNESKTG